MQGDSSKTLELVRAYYVPTRDDGISKLRRLKLARDFRELEGLLCDSVSEILDSLDRGEEILVEGPKGYT